MKPRRSLALRSESLSELTAGELAGVAGGADHTTPLVACVSQAFSCAIYDPNSIVCQVSRLVC
jgi:hypothetical protein